MAFTAVCPKCNGEAEVFFELDSAQKMIRCPCGHIAPLVGSSFDPQPEFLFKYRPHDGYSESWILNEELFFASPAMFNDPFDSKVMYTLDGTLQQKKKYISGLIEDRSPEIKKREKWKIVKRALEDEVLEKDYPHHIARMQQHIDKYGVVSFSRKPDNLLMFSYYAKDHTGYCLKYRRSAENILSMARPIHYEECYPKFSVFELDPRKMGILGDKVLFVKAKCWSHEDEWRLSFTGFTTRVVKSPHPILEAIILGCNMKSEPRKEIMELNQRRMTPVAIFEARKMQFEFALEIVPVSP